MQIYLINGRVLFLRCLKLLVGYKSCLNFFVEYSLNLLPIAVICFM